jgi:hypothetical protein
MSWERDGGGGMWKGGGGSGGSAGELETEGRRMGSTVLFCSTSSLTHTCVPLPSPHSFLLLPSTQAHACAATVNFAENIDEELLPPYLDVLITKLLVLLQHGKKLVQEGALTAMASIADCSKVGLQEEERREGENQDVRIRMGGGREEGGGNQPFLKRALCPAPWSPHNHLPLLPPLPPLILPPPPSSPQALFVKYYDTVMPLLYSILVGATDKAHRLLRAKALECISLVAMAVGKDRFREDATRVMQVRGEGGKGSSERGKWRRREGERGKGRSEQHPPPFHLPHPISPTFLLSPLRYSSSCSRASWRRTTRPSATCCRPGPGCASAWARSSCPTWTLSWAPCWPRQRLSQRSRCEGEEGEEGVGEEGEEGVGEEGEGTWGRRGRKTSSARRRGRRKRRARGELDPPYSHFPHPLTLSQVRDAEEEDDEEEDEDVEKILLGDRLITIRTSSLEEKVRGPACC